MTMTPQVNPPLTAVVVPDGADPDVTTPSAPVTPEHPDTSSNTARRHTPPSTAATAPTPRTPPAQSDQPAATLHTQPDGDQWMVPRIVPGPTKAGSADCPDPGLA